MARRLATLGILLAVSLLTIASFQSSNDRVAFACSCVQPKPPQAELEESNAVFSGKVIDLETTDDLYPSKLVTFDVHTIWKGNISKDSLRLTTGMGDADCGYYFELNNEYLVYAYGNPEAGDLGASACTNTKPLDKAQADLAVLGQGDTTFGGEMATTGSKFVVQPFLIIAAVIGIAGAVITTIVLKKRK